MFFNTWVKALFIGAIVLSQFVPVFAGQNVGKLLQLAMESRKSAGINEVSRLFQNALLHAENPYQKVSVLTAFADYLLEKQAYEQALSLYKRIINEGSENDSVYACYCSIYFREKRPGSCRFNNF